MSFLRLSFALCIMSLVLSPAAFAQEGVQLAFQYHEGETLEYDISMSGSGGLRGPDAQLAPAGMRGSMRLSVTVKEVLPDGNARLALFVPEAEFQMNIEQQQARFSYRNGQLRWYADGREQTPPDADISQAPLLGVPLEVIASPRGHIVDVILPEMQKLEAQQMIPGLSITQIRNLGEPPLPANPVRVGETWRTSINISPFGPLIPIYANTSHTLDSYEENGGIGLARISGYSDANVRVNNLSISPGEASITVAVPEMRNTVTSTEFFNVTEGKLIRGDYDSSFVTRASVTLGGQSQEAGLEARFRMTVQAR